MNFFLDSPYSQSKTRLYPDSQHLVHNKGKSNKEHVSSMREVKKRKIGPKIISYLPELVIHYFGHGISIIGITIIRIPIVYISSALTVVSERKRHPRNMHKIFTELTSTNTTI